MDVKDELAKKAGRRTKSSDNGKNLGERSELPEDFPIRLLKAGEIECRVSTVSEKGVSLLLYKDARVDQRLLDEAFTPFGWKRSHQCINGNLYCTVEICNPETGEWIGKQDVGTEGHAEKEKSQASDSFKRACFNWGIGRELYSAPFIWIPADKTAVVERNGKYVCRDHFTVSSISYNREREISSLVIVNGKGRIVFQWNARKNDNAEPVPLSDAQRAALSKELQRTGVSEEEVKRRYQVSDINQMPEATYQRVMQALSKTKANAA